MRRCTKCKQYKKLNADNYKQRNRIRKSGEVIISFEYKCRPCSNEDARARGNPNYQYTGGRGGVRKKIKHTGPVPGSIYHKFFCT